MIGSLMNAGEAAIRLRGYHAVSFRELADELGIKSSSVHYYFRQKEDLGLALVQRYRERFFDALEQRAATAQSSEAKLAAFCAVYRAALVNSDKHCLCGMLGAESCGLPVALSDEVNRFFAASIDWLMKAMPDDLGASDQRKRAVQILATLQGAMMLSSSMKDYRAFDDVVSALLPIQQ